MIVTNLHVWRQMTEDSVKDWCYLGIGIHCLFAAGLYKLYKEVNLQLIGNFEKLESSANMMIGLFGAYGVYLSNNSKIYLIMKET